MGFEPHPPKYPFSRGSSLGLFGRRPVAAYPRFNRSTKPQSANTVAAPTEWSWKRAGPNLAIEVRVAPRDTVDCSKFLPSAESQLMVHTDSPRKEGIPAEARGDPQGAPEWGATRLRPRDGIVKL